MLQSPAKEAPRSPACGSLGCAEQCGPCLSRKGTLGAARRQRNRAGPGQGCPVAVPGEEVFSNPTPAPVSPGGGGCCDPGDALRGLLKQVAGFTAPERLKGLCGGPTATRVLNSTVREASRWSQADLAANANSDSACDQE